MRIAVFGTGGAGGYFGARLAQAGEEVVFIARGPHLQAIRERGLRVDTEKGTLVVPAHATDDPREIGSVDVVLVGVKAWQVSEAALALQPLVGANTVVVPLQNGVEAVAQLASVLGEAPVIGGLCGTVSFIVAPGHIRSIGDRNFIRFGELHGEPSDRTDRLRQAFVRAGVAVEIPTDITAALWEKFLFVVAWGGVGSVARAPIGVLRGVPETRRLLEQAMGEIFEVARARQVALAAKLVDRSMSFIDSLSPDATTSLQRDLAAGKPSELEAWNGAVVRLGREVDVATPLHSFIYSSLRPLALHARGEIAFPSTTSGPFTETARD
jgi:2-dehydropantoate 2-reductase